MYEVKGKVRYSETDSEGKLTIPALLNYFQDSSTFHSEDVGNGMEVVESLKRVWVLSSWQIVVNEYPKIGERIKLGTWPYDFNRFFGGRNFIMYGADGRVLAYANSLWTYLNSENGRPARVEDQIVELYELEPKYDMEYADRKIALPEEMEAKTSFPVEVYHLDTNHHVNNGQYVKMAGAYLPQGFEIAQMRAEYKKSAVLGDIICPKVYEEANKVIVSLEDQCGNVFTIVEFTSRLDK